MSAAAIGREQFNRILARTLVLPLALITICPFVFLGFGWHLMTAMQEARRSTEVIGAAFEVETLLVDLETAVRGYQANSDPLFLEPYNRAEPALDVAFDNLQKLALDNPEILQEITLIRRDHEVWNAHATEAIRRVRAGQKADLAFNGQGKALMDRTRSDMSALIGAEREILWQRSAAVGTLKQSTIEWTFAAFLAAALGTAFWVGRQMRVIRRSYADSLMESENQRESFRVTLASIGDAVIVTDRNGKITFLNDEAQRLTGWDRNEALGRSLKAVFRIVNEDTREPVDDPVERVYRENRVVGLANHTALISKNGVEWLIEDSAAPIFDSSRNIVGVVLVFQDATERRKAQKDMLRARDDALAASRSKDKFLAALSHELRTPLNPVLLLASEAAADPNLPEGVRADFDTIVKNVSIEARLIDDLLDITSITRGKMSFDMRVIDLRSVLDDAVKTLNHEIAAKELSFEAEYGEVAIMVNADSARLRQVFWNLVKNAIKFTPRAGGVCVALERSSVEEVAVVRVSDSGIGMTAAEIARVFEFFSQGDHAISDNGHRYGGLGLGLAISKMIVEAHRGGISIESSGPNTGCTVRVRLPLSEKTTKEIPGHQDLGSGSENGSTSKRRILLVEDHAPTREVLVRLLEKRDFVVVQAGTVAEAIAAAEIRNPDLLISDLGLPDGDGFMLLAQIRNRTKVLGIALTGFGMEADLARTQEAGFAAHLTKPVTVQALDDALRKTGIRGNDA